MSAGSQTWTIPAGQKYIDKDGISHVITTSEDILFTFTDDGTGGRFIGRIGDATKVLCTDGFKFDIECDPRFTFSSSADGSATLNNGELCIVEQSGTRVPWNVRSLTVADADGVGSNNISSITLEQVDNTSRTITWALVTTA